MLQWSVGCLRSIFLLQIIDKLERQINTNDPLNDNTVNNINDANEPITRFGDASDWCPSSETCTTYINQLEIHDSMWPLAM